MKTPKIVLLLLMYSCSLFSQENMVNKIKKSTQVNIFDSNSKFNGKLPQRDKINPVDVGGVIIGGSQNAIGTLLSSTNQVYYSPNINTVAFIHRALNSGTGNSAELSIDFSTNGGETWTTEAWITHQMGTNALCRYPMMTIFAPNNSLSNARFVANGPALIYNSSWGKTFEIDATVSSNPVTHEWYGTNNGDFTDYHPYGLTIGPDGTVWSISGSYDTQTSLNLDNLYINKAVYNSSTDQFDWTSPLFTITPEFYYSEYGDKLLNDWEIAVDPNNGDVVYAIISGVEVGDSKQIPSPHLWKSDNGGTTWTELPPIDLNLYTSDLEPYIYHPVGVEMLPYFKDIDATIDITGRLHLMCEVWSGYTDFGYVYNGFTTTGLPTRHYFDFSTTDGTNWSIIHIAGLESEPAPWGTTETEMHPTIARNSNADRIFWLWSDTYEDIDSINTEPNIYVKAWAANGQTTDVTNLTNGTGAQAICYFPQFSPIIIDNLVENGTGPDFEFPVVLPLIDYNTGVETDPVDYIYLKDFGIADWTNFSIYQHPGDAQICENSNAEFTVLAMRAQTYQWQESTDNGANFININDAGIYTGTNTKTLSISNTEGLNGYIYRCVVTDGLGGTLVSASASIMMYDLIPANAGDDQTLCNENTTFLYANDPSPGIGQWSIMSGTGSFDDINSPVTNVTDLQEFNALIWSIMNGYCESSDTVNIYVITSNAGSDQMICQDFVTLSANDPIVGTGTWTIVQGNGTFVNINDHETMVNGIEQGENIYNWNITNNDCSIDDQVSVYRYIDPEILTQPESVSANIGSNVEFSIDTNGDISGFQWRKDGSILSDGGNISGALTSSLYITDISINDSGEYDCIINGICTNLNSDVALLTVNTGIEDRLTLGFRIFPNPINENLNIVFDSNGNYDKTVEITDYLGKTVLKEALKSDLKTIKLDVGQLKPGVYFVKIGFNNKTNHIFKLIKE